MDGSLNDISLNPIRDPITDPIVPKQKASSIAINCFLFAIELSGNKIAEPSAFELSDASAAFDELLWLHMLNTSELCRIRDHERSASTGLTKGKPFDLDRNDEINEPSTNDFKPGSNPLEKVLAAATPLLSTKSRTRGDRASDKIFITSTEDPIADFVDNQHKIRL